MDIDAIHKALANPVRREILHWLKEPQCFFPEQTHSVANGVCAGAIDGRCGLSQSTVSAHLATLQRAGLVTTQRIGQWVYFKRNEETIQAFLTQLNEGL
ncbi:ArsR/SmtB family transcription factor [Pararobbsia silviterrae]|uniref:Transcriptional regulator n=1 Tax=Pararobbsia silviterrae TaxID=1792498 RepID=A0A494XJI2_9BURK|nr:helix-turn-helix transcriptional regulator [Pararobbsia silviterrae]RKP47723.1 transcriptional regulator [Pararobbsia silviterrae]